MDLFLDHRYVFASTPAQSVPIDVLVVILAILAIILGVYFGAGYNKK